MTNINPNEIEELEAALGSFMRLIKKPCYWEEFQKRAKVDIDRPSGAIIQILFAADLNFQSLVTKLGIEAPFVSRKVHELEMLHLIERKPNQDKRIHMLHLTKQGEEIATNLSKAKQDILSEILKGWSDQQRTDLIRALKKLSNDMYCYFNLNEKTKKE